MVARLTLVVLLTLMCAVPTEAGTRAVACTVRGTEVTLTVYVPSQTPAGTVIMGSGDVGWVGLAVTMANVLVGKGYVVAGLNSRQYLSSFTDGKNHVMVGDVPGDLRTMAQCLRAESLLPAPVVLSGVSEGAAIMVLAAANTGNHAWVDGLITMGIPETAELAWRWKDIGAWIRKTDANEPSFRPYDFVAGVAPVPFAMIQSTRDEYVTASTYQPGYAAAGSPKQLILIEAANHRFTDRLPELQARYLGALTWVRSRLP